jgi:hypothetical protein
LRTCSRQSRTRRAGPLPGPPPRRLVPPHHLVHGRPGVSRPDPRCPARRRHDRRRAKGGGDPQADELLPLSGNEIRRLIAKLAQVGRAGMEQILRWSAWRRRRQAQARTSHYRQRLDLLRRRDPGLQYTSRYARRTFTQAAGCDRSRRCRDSPSGETPTGAHRRRWNERFHEFPIIPQRPAATLPGRTQVAHSSPRQRRQAMARSGPHELKDERH